METLTPYFTAWRVIRAGRREVIEGLVAPEHQGPSRDLMAALGAWPYAHYWAGPPGKELVLIRPVGPPRREAWLVHLGLFAVTVLCALGAGAALSGDFVPPTGAGIAGALAAGARFFFTFLQAPGSTILSGWPFAAPLLAILLVHELGHYFVAHRYAIDASPPYFLPIPPTISPIGSLGAFLRLRSPVVDRRQLLDVGAAGPLAGFLVVLAVLAWGYATSTTTPAGAGLPRSFVEFAGMRFGLGDSLLTRACRWLFLPGAESIHLSGPAFAGWAGALITGLNLLPLSQLDGGHVAYGLMGRWQKPLGLATLLGLVWLAQYWSAWLIWVLLTLMVGGWRWTHPSVMCPERPVPPGRRVLGWLCVVVFVVTFMPVPFG
jgi:membrane-associated protease RseP (regulator of RpoE activity)